MNKKWTIEEDFLLKSIYENSSKKEISSKINKSWLTIRRRALRLGLHRDPDIINADKKIKRLRKDSWTQEEENLLREIYETNTKEYITQKINRPWSGIWSRAYSLGLHRREDIVKKEMIEGGSSVIAKDMWTKEENDLLISLYEKTPREEILIKINRTWLAIRNRAFKLKLRRDPELIKKENVEYQSRSLMKKYGVKYSTQLDKMKNSSRNTNLNKLGVEYPTQSNIVKEKVKRTVRDRYGVDNVFQNEDIKDKIGETNIKKYGYKYPLQNPEVLKKMYEKIKSLGLVYGVSKEELSFYEYLKIIDPDTKHHVLNSDINSFVDFYMPKYDLWVQYDGYYWHGKKLPSEDSRHYESILKTMDRDAYQNNTIENLVRFWSDEINKAIIEKNVVNVIKNNVELTSNSSIKTTMCHQYKKKIENFEEDLKTLSFDQTKVKASDFILSKEKMSDEIKTFIEKYEWLGNIGAQPKWCFTARYNGILGGVVLINEPTSYSKILGKDTPKYEALIQRGASASWTPKNTGSRLIMFSCKWMVNNTKKRIFMGYSDPRAYEVGTIYQACNFEYLGNNFGNSYMYINPNIKNGKLFSAQSIKRTSYFKLWLRKNNISIQNEWFKDSGFKDLSKIPLELKNRWYNWIKEILDNSEKVPVDKKGKYVLVLGRDKKDQKYLNSLKSYSTHPYPKRPI